MTDKIEFEIVTPERQVLAEQVDEVVLPAAKGYMEVLPGHAPLLTALDIGEVSYRIGNKRHYLVVTGGFAEILRESVNILAKTCERAEEIDVDRAKKAEENARGTMTPAAAAQEFRHAEVKLKRALSRISVHGRLSA